MHPRPAAQQAPPPWVLITGGSHGIGLALAKECLRRELRVAIVALPDHNLKRVRQDFPRARTLGLDLTADGAAERLIGWLDTQHIRPHYLINNAGFGRGGLIEHTPWQEYRTMLDLNNRVVVELTYRLLPRLKGGGGGILNLSSMEATLPLPYKTVYTGTKAFVYNFSLALREELRYHKLSVSVLCPGPVVTNEDGMRRLEAQGGRARLLVMMPDELAPQAITGMLEGKDVIVPGRLPRLLVALGHLVPRSLRMRLLERVFRRYRNDGVKDTPVSSSLSAQSRRASSSS